MNTLGGLRNYETTRHERAFWCACAGCRSAMPATSGQLAKAYLKCELTMELVTEFISNRRASPLSCLLAGGDKRTQQRDIEIAKELARDL